MQRKNQATQYRVTIFWQIDNLWSFFLVYILEASNCPNKSWKTYFDVLEWTFTYGYVMSSHSESLFFQCREYFHKSSKIHLRAWLREDFSHVHVPLNVCIVPIVQQCPPSFLPSTDSCNTMYYLTSPLSKLTSPISSEENDIWFFSHHLRTEAARRGRRHMCDNKILARHSEPIPWDLFSKEIAMHFRIKYHYSPRGAPHFPNVFGFTNEMRNQAKVRT